MGSISGERKAGGSNTLKSRRVFGHNVKGACARPSDVTVRDLLGNEEFLEAVLKFLGSTGVGPIKERVVLDGG